MVKALWRHVRRRTGEISRGLLLLLLSGAPLPACALAIHVAVEPDPPPAGESFRLVFVVEGNLSTEPDFSALEDDFEIRGRNQQSSMSIVNGEYARRTTWALEVLPRTEGAVEVPAITFGQARSEAFTVHPGSGGRTAEQPPDDGLFLEVEANPPHPYVQQEVRYTVRLWRRYEISNASLSEPRLSADALVKPAGEDRQYVEERGGRRYEVVERSYLIYPQTSGTVTVEPVRVTAQVLERVTSLFDMFGRGVKTRRVDSSPLTLSVRPIPDTFPPDSPWLPARRLRLNELWTPDDLTARAGEPITRTLSLWASGLTSGQLPELALGPAEGLQQYPDPAQAKDDFQHGEQQALRQQKVAYLGAAAGTFEIPALVLPWWNVSEDRLEYARLPARRLEILPAAGSAVTPPGEPAPGADGHAVESLSPSRAASPVPARDWRQWPGWFGVALAALGGWLLTLLALPAWLGRKVAGGRRHAEQPSRAQPSASLSQRHAEVLAACAADDAAGARRALLAWGAIAWSDDPPLSLGALARRLDPIPDAPLAALDRACHGRGGEPWQGAALAAAFKAVPPSAPARLPPEEGLPPLFRLVGRARIR